MATLNFLGKYSDQTFEVDDEDVDRVLEHRWHLMVRGTQKYAVCRSVTADGKQTTTYLQHLVMGSKRRVHPRDGSYLNCRKSNLSHEYQGGRGRVLVMDGDELVDELVRETPVNRAVKYLYDVNRLLIELLEKHGIGWNEYIKELSKDDE